MKPKNCPFCGGEARVKHGKYNELGAYGTPEKDHKWFGVCCKTCGVSQPKRKYESKEESVAAWNDRV